MNIRILTVSVLVLISAAVIGFSQEPREKKAPAGKSPMPVYITPFYNFEGPKISVGDYSEKLARADAKTILPITAALEKEKQKLRTEVMFVAAIRLYDLGLKDKSVYWFYSARYRAILFDKILDKEKIGSIGAEAFELKQAYNSFGQLAGTYINGYAFGDLAKLQKTIEQVLDEGKSLPSFAEIYPKVAFCPEKTWADKNKDVAKGITGLRDYLRSNADDIKEQRKKNGIEGKY